MKDRAARIRQTHQTARVEALVTVICVAVAMTVCAGCGLQRSRSTDDLSPPYDADKYDTLRFQGIDRTYMVYVPGCYEQGIPIPLVLNFHGGGGTGESAEIGVGGMNAKAESECFLAVYPNGASSVGQPGKQQHWNAGPRLQTRNPGVDDVGFVTVLLDTLEQRFSIDTARVFATGISNGGMMSHRLACDISERLAAVAPVGAGMLEHNCAPTRPVALMQFHGMADPGWPYLGGRGCFTDDLFEPIAQTISRWKELDDCADTMRVSFENGDARCEAYEDCAGNASVTLCTIEDGGHTWPGGEVLPSEELLRYDSDCAIGRGVGVGPVTRDISALDAMWAFFAAHPMGG